MRSEYKIITTALLIIIIFGIAPSLICSDWEWFSRSGSLLVIYGVYITWKDYKGKMNESFSRVARAMSGKHNNELQDIRENTNGVINTSIAEDKENDSFYDELDILKEFKISRIKAYEIIEFLIIALGTIVWGYGNLINEIANNTP